MTSIKVGYDAKRLFHNQSGLGNYSRTLIDGIGQFTTNLECVLYSPDAQRSAFYDRYKDHEIVSRRGLGASFWRSFTQAQSWKSDGLTHYHGLSHELPYWSDRVPEVKKIVTIHDLIQIKYPEDHKPLDRYIYNQKIARALAISDHVICISESTKNDVLTHFKIPEEKCSVVYQSFAQHFLKKNTKLELEQVKKKYDLPEDYVLFLGGTRPRKNLKGLLQAFSKMSTEAPLVLLGNVKAYSAAISQLDTKLRSRISLCHAEWEDIPAIYDLASLFVYPSIYEGFGIPILEAFARRTPVIASKTSSIPEAAGEAAVLIDPLDSDALAASIDDLLQNSEMRDDLVKKGEARLALFSIEEFAKNTAGVYRRLM